MVDWVVVAARDSTGLVVAWTYDNSVTASLLMASGQRSADAPHRRLGDRGLRAGPPGRRTAPNCGHDALPVARVEAELRRAASAPVPVSAAGAGSPPVWRTRRGPVNPGAVTFADPGCRRGRSVQARLTECCGYACAR